MVSQQYFGMNNAIGLDVFYAPDHLYFVNKTSQISFNFSNNTDTVSGENLETSLLDKGYTVIV